jgi:hypothetical protein
VELKRAIYIAIQTVKRILPISLRTTGLNDCAGKCEQVETIADAAAAAIRTAYAYGAAAPEAATAAAAAAIRCVKVAIATSSIAAAADAAAAKKEIFTIAVAILDEAIKLGNQAEPIEATLINQRMESIKRRALARVE